MLPSVIQVIAQTDIIRYMLTRPIVKGRIGKWTMALSELKHYMLPSVTQVIAQTDVIRYMLTRSIVKGWIGMWTMALSKFSLQYVPQKALKSQALANFLAQHLSPYCFRGSDVEIGMVKTRDNFWIMYCDGSST